MSTLSLVTPFPFPCLSAFHSFAYSSPIGITVVEDGVHVLDLFAGITCAGLRVVLAVGMKVKYYTSVEWNEVSRGISNEVWSKLQSEYPHQLPDSTLKGHSKRLPQNIKRVGEDDLRALLRCRGEVHFVCRGWQC